MAVLSFVLDGQGIPSTVSSQTIRTALKDAQGPIANSVLIACHQALLRDFSSLSADDQIDSGILTPYLAAPTSLLELPLHYPTNAIAANVQLYLVQLLRYLTYAGDGFTSPEGERTDSEIYGFSSGMLAATVIACSRDIPSFITHAVSICRLAFWLGLRSQQHANNLLRESLAESSCTSTWNLVIFGSTRAEVQVAIDRYNNAHPGLPRLYLSAVTHQTCISVSVRPRTLSTFRSYFLPSSSTTSRFTPIHALYHCAELEGIKATLLADTALLGIHLPGYNDLVHRLRSAVTGQVIEGSNCSAGSTLVEEILDMVLLHPVNFDYITAALNREYATTASPRSLVNLGPGNVLWRSIARTCPNIPFTMIDCSAASEPDLAEPLSSNILPIRNNTAQREPIAIVGMAVKFPQANDATELWGVLERGLNTVSEIPLSRFNVSEYTASDHGPGRAMKTNYGNFIDDPSLFDNAFFRVSPREARSMDPQQRLLLHVSYHALENAGYVPGSTQSFDPDTFAVYVGVATNDYAQNLRKDIDVYYSTGTLHAFLSGKISYAFGFSGPSLVIDTACSSSMVAIHQACRALHNKDCNAALAGGVNVITSPDMYIGLDRAHFLSPTGQCKPWDASADGYCRSEGCGMFVLKRLSDALAENDNILGVIRGVEVNHSAKADSITQPHVPTQIGLFNKLLTSSGVKAADVSVIEAHGTGTKAGDPTEIRSIRAVFAQNRPRTNPLHLTSIKANIGHAEAASGAASLAKLLLMLRNRTIPPVISLKELNPRIKDLASDGTCIDTELVPWRHTRSGRGGRLAVLNNFGAAGSNAAMVLEEAPPLSRSVEPCLHAFVLGLSCDSVEALEERRRAYLHVLRHELSDSSLVALGDFTYTATARRLQYRYRLSAAGKSKEDLCANLEHAQHVDVRHTGIKTIFVFSGQGGQYSGMGARLYQTLPAFRRVVDYCHNKLLEWGFAGILSVINPQDGEGTVEDIQAYQCAVFALECALASAWSSWGLEPAAVVGHSLGEYAALVSAQVLSLDDALRLVAGRARLMVEKCILEESGMLAVKITPDDMARILEDYDGLSVACYNSCEDIVVAGKLDQLDRLQAFLKQSGYKCARVKVPYGYHTSAMDPILESLTSLVSSVELHAPTIPIVSNVHGSVVLPGDASVFTAQYFARHCGEPVQFEAGICELRGLSNSDDVSTWLELGPHPTTVPMLRAGSTSTRDVYFPSMRKNCNDWHIMAETLAGLYCLPGTLQWRAVFADISPDARLTELPAYPFAKTRFWVPYEEDAPASCPQIQPSPLATRFTLLGSCIFLPTPGSPDPAIFDTPISQLSRLIEGHTVAGHGLCPASVYVEMVTAATELVSEHFGQKISGKTVVTSDITFSNPLVYASDIVRTVRTSVTLSSVGDKQSGSFTVASYTSDSNALQVHCSGSVRVLNAASVEEKLALSSTTVDRRKSAIEMCSQAEVFHTRTLYQVVFPRIVAYSSAYQAIKTITIDSNGIDSFAIMQLPRDTISGVFTVHPIFTDTFLHAAGFVINCNAKQNEAFICSQVDKVRILSSQINPDAQYGVYCNIGFMSDTFAVADAYAFELGKPNVTLVAHIKRMRFRKLRLTGFAALLSASVSTSTPQSSRLPLRERVESSIAAHNPLSKPKPAPLTTLDTRSDLSRIKDVISSVLGLQPSQITEDDDLERLGLDSLTSIEARHTLCSLLKVTLPDDLFSNCKTIRHIGAALASSPSVSGGFPPTPVTAQSETALVDIALSAPAEGLRASDSLDQVVDIMASVLGIAVQDLSVKDDLERLGMDSLMSIEAHHAISSTLRLELPDDLFSSCKTILEVQNAIEAASRSYSSTNLTPFSTNMNPVQFQTHLAGNAAPLFLIHDGSGVAHCYGRLSSLGRSVWGVHNPKFSTGESWTGGIIEMAAHYASLIKGKLSTGQACVLGGWSVGGVIAFEVARQLMSTGTIVKGLILIDSPHPHTSTPLTDDLIDFVFSTRAAGSSRAAELARAQMKHATRALVAYNPDKPPAQTYMPQKTAYLRSREAFKSGDLIVQDRFLSDRDDTVSMCAGWESALGYAPIIMDIPGNHFEPFEPHHVNEVSLRLSDALGLFDE